MPRAKRPLADVNPNASNASNRNAKFAKTNPKDNAGNATKDIGLEVKNVERRKLPAKNLQSAKEAQERALRKPVQAGDSKAPPTLSRLRLTRHAMLSPNQSSESVGESEISTRSSGNEEKMPAAHTGEKIEYRSKDNSKLRRFLSERDLPTTGTREELILRLENSSIDYNDLPSGKIVEMLKERHITMGGVGPRETKIERLRLNDELERDTGTSAESVLYGAFSAIEWILNEKLALQGKVDKALTPYESLAPGKLCKILEKRNLSGTGSREVLIKRLNTDDQKTLIQLKAKYKSYKLELEAARGRPVESGEMDKVLKEENKRSALDSKIQREAPVAQSTTPRCEYNWKDSHWAVRTERELSEICRRREMPGYGTKAAMIKWLETGQLDYEDVSVGSLQSMCAKRGVHCKSNFTKADIIERLRASDDADGEE